MNPSGAVVHILTLAFGVLALNVFVINPMLQTAAEFQANATGFNNTTIDFGSSFSNTTQNTTVASGDAGTVICDNGSIGFRWKIPAWLTGVVGQLVADDIKFCPPAGFSGDFLNDTTNQALAALVLVIAFAVGAVIAGKFAGSHAAAVFATIGVMVAIGLVFLTVMLSNLGIASLMPGGVGLAVFALAMVFGVFTIVVLGFSMLSNRGGS